MSKLKVKNAIFYLLLFLALTCFLPSKIYCASLPSSFEGFLNDSTVKVTTNKGMGSGFIINTEGYIITSRHVVENTPLVRVTLANGKTFNGRVESIDDNNDIALVRLKGNNLPVARLGSSNDLKNNDLIFSSVFINEKPKLLQGKILSPKINHEKGEFIYSDIILTPGSSGGPVFNESGEIIGINTMATKNGSLSIPVNELNKFLNEVDILGNISLSAEGSALGSSYEISDFNIFRVRHFTNSFFVLSIVIVLVPAIIVWYKRKKRILEYDKYYDED